MPRFVSGGDYAPLSHRSLRAGGGGRADAGRGRGRGLQGVLLPRAARSERFAVAGHTPWVPANPALAADDRFRQLRDWDLPSKVTPWSERPSAADIARRRDELARTSGRNNAASQAVSRAYELAPFARRDWQDLEKWFGKEGPKKLPGLCVDQERAGYVLALGLISDGSAGASLSGVADRTLYDQSVVDKDSSIGPNAGTATLGGSNRPAQELSGMSNSARPGVYTCAYLYRVNSDRVTGDRVTGDRVTGGARQATPDYYYCHAGDDMPKSAVTTMLKYLAKRNP